MGQGTMALAGKRVLVAEDVLVIAQEIEQILRRMGCEVVGAAPTVEIALQLVNDEPLDAAVIDLNLHGKSADTIIQALEVKAVPYLVVSGYDSPQITGLAGNAPRLQKPFGVGDLEREVERLMASAGAR